MIELVRGLAHTSIVMVVVVGLVMGVLSFCDADTRGDENPKSSLFCCCGGMIDNIYAR